VLYFGSYFELALSFDRHCGYLYIQVLFLVRKVLALLRFCLLAAEGCIALAFVVVFVVVFLEQMASYCRILDFVLAPHALYLTMLHMLMLIGS